MPLFLFSPSVTLVCTFQSGSSTEEGIERLFFSQPDLPTRDLFHLALAPVNVSVAAAHRLLRLPAAVDRAVGAVQLVQAERNRDVKHLRRRTDR